MDLSGDLIGLILEGSCAEDAIKADSARVNSFIDLEKYLFAAASTPYERLPKKIVFRYREKISSLLAELSSSKAR